MHILLVDDEALARSRLRTLLADAARADPALPPMVVEEAADGAQAWASLQAASFELVLLDIHMPGQGGLSLAARLRELPRAPALVFVTADSLHAVNAFELEALDYLTKPVRLGRLQVALGRLMRQRAALPPPSPGMLLIQDRGRTERVPLEEVLYFKAELKYLTVRTATHSYILDSALGELEARHGAQFLRIHRNALVARHALRALQKHHDPEEGEGWAVRLQGIEEPLAVSRRQLASVRAALREAADSV
ncbi:LytR/AlgR family response regulator transcription factor [Comamonas endophytica]|uniref:LytTR family DNA-binding domain-containing protein n=1 Tax=Comamonas endophytica TaxID=2949090 RepID=A0ABY6GFL3_9BURK|nr:MULTISPECIES: LytTR family DNA-binding domain-containing protein [unclassified Acidovorax]MCD2513477.1 LytTR family DNA-binding domain-containing protein [Acidovorax sp. D4N7]UYG53254.1 LytTR family DNA-binding domain-containing protein [Acidovorax sp. 5MLIR]